MVLVLGQTWLVEPHAPVSLLDHGDDPQAFLAKAVTLVANWDARRQRLAERTPSEEGQLMRDQNALPDEVQYGQRAWRPLNQACLHLGVVPGLSSRRKRLRLSRRLSPHLVALAPTAVLCRTALLAAAKTVYLLAPNDPGERQVRALELANSESASARQMLAEAGKIVEAMETPATLDESLAQGADESDAAIGAALEERGHKPGRRVSELRVVTGAAGCLGLDDALLWELRIAWQFGSQAAHAAMGWHALQAHIEQEVHPAEALASHVLAPLVMTDAAWQLWTLRRREK